MSLSLVFGVYPFIVSVYREKVNLSLDFEANLRFRGLTLDFGVRVTLEFKFNPRSRA
jgi:hypothetical protein